jgi:hypothetical protein
LPMPPPIQKRPLPNKFLKRQLIAIFELYFQLDEAVLSSMPAAGPTSGGAPRPSIGLYNSRKLR